MSSKASPLRWNAAWTESGTKPSSSISACRSNARCRRFASSVFREIDTSSPPTDFRAHHPRLLRPEELAAIESIGPVAGMVGIMVGFGPNFMSAVRSGSRLVLENGYHRADTLRSLGLTHAYCVVEDVTRKDESGSPQIPTSSRTRPSISHRSGRQCSGIFSIRGYARCWSSCRRKTRSRWN